MTTPVYIKDVVTLEYEPAKCTGCGLCVDVCPHRVFVMMNNRARVTDKDQCMECGACVLNCKDVALTVNSGVGCAAAVINGYFNKSQPTCGCDSSESACC